jgi:UDP-glucose 4-epimerase
MRILVTGGSGFLGGRLANTMIASGHEVLISGRHLNKPVSWLPEAQIRSIDWDDQDCLTSACCDVDIVIHAAGTNARDCEIDPIGALNFNGVATTRLVQASIVAGVKRFIYLSTAHVYDEQIRGVVNEACCPNNIHPYATSKLAGEKAVLWADRSNGFNGVVLRVSNVFGAPMHKDVNFWSLLIPNLCRQVVEIGKINLFSNAQSHRDFMSASSFCKTVLHISEIDSVSLGPKVINVGSGVTRSLLEVASAVRDRSFHVLGIRPEIEFDKSCKDSSSSYSFSTASLNALGIFNSDLNFEGEIDNLLIFCKANFLK